MKEGHYCSICGGVLTSKRSIKRGYGQRCGWRKYGRKKRSSNVPHMKEDVDFKPLGKEVKSGVIVQYVQSQLGDY